MVDKGKKRTSVLAHVGVPVRFEVGDLVKKAEGVVVPSKGDKDVPSVAADSSSEYFALVERAVRTVSRGERRRWNGRHVWLGDGGWD